MSKTIWFVNKDCAPIEEYGTHLRTVKQAQYFQSIGYKVKILCSSSVHNSNINHVEKGKYKEEIKNEVPFLFVKSLSYKGNGIKRVLAYILFAYNVYRLIRKKERPDIVIHTSRIPFDYLIYLFVRKIKAKYIIDVTDLWPMEIEHFGFLKPNGLVLKVFYKIERKLYSKADHVVFSEEGYKDYLREKRWTKEQGDIIDLIKTHYVNNGVDLLEFESDLKEFKIEDEDLENESIFRVIYLGSIRQANHLDTLIDAAKELVDFKNIKVLVYGDGPERELLEKRVVEENINNVVFKQKWIELKYVPYVLSKAHINLLNYAKNWAPYGGSMNKMMMSFASGKPIVCNAGMNYSPIRENSLGVDKVFNNSKEYADAILQIYNLPLNEYNDMCMRTKETANQFDTKILCQMFKEYCEL